MSRKSERVNFPGGNGFQLAGIIDRPATSDPDIVAVFSHCFTCGKDLKAIVRISRALAVRGIAVLRFDMTGLGNSGGEFAKTNFSTNLADLKAAMVFAQERFGHVDALIGHSFGGAAALATAGRMADSQWGHDLAVVTLAAPSDTRHLADLLAAKDPEIESVGRGQVEIGGFQWDIDRQMLDDFRQHDLSESIRLIRGPTMLFHSPVDQTVPYWHAQQILKWLWDGVNHPATSLVSLDRADHLLLSHPDDVGFVAETAAAFLNRYANP